MDNFFFATYGRAGRVCTRFFYVVVLTLVSFHSLQAQNSRDFVIANSLMRQGSYAEAIPLYEELLRTNPFSQPIVNNLLNCYAETKKYDRAIETISAFGKNNGTNVFMIARLGGFHLLAGDTTMALEVWNRALETQSGDNNVYREIAREMADRGLTKQAIDTYLKARQVNDNPYLYTNELANLYLKLGDYQNTAKEWLLLIVDDPTRTNVVQRRLYRFEDDDLLDALIVEGERIAGTYYPGEFHYQSLKELLIWLYSERKLYRKALASAKALEEIVAQPAFMPVFNLALRFKSINEYEMGVQALNYYTENQQHLYHNKAQEETAYLHIDWAQHLELQELVHPKVVEEKIQTAIGFLDALMESNPGYRASRPLDFLKAELEMDYLFKADYGRQLLQKTEFSADERYLTPQQNFLKGRVALFDNNFTDARIYLTRSKKRNDTGDLAEKAAFYLGYGDFLNGEFEFSAIQFRALERNTTSYFANNALKVRNWVQMGTQKDSVLPELTLFAKTRRLYEQGQWTEALASIKSVLESQNKDLNAEAVYIGYLIMQRQHPEQAYKYIADHVSKSQGSPGRERLLWFRALSALQVLASQPETALNLTSEESFFLGNQPTTAETPSLTAEDVASLFEEIVLQYPDGYYAQFARSYLRKLEIRS